MSSNLFDSDIFDDDIDLQSDLDVSSHLNLPKFIDLGLPSGTLWCDRNLGANNIYEAGDYYAWGETKPRTDQIGKNYKFAVLNKKGFKRNQISKYNTIDKKTILEPIDNPVNIILDDAVAMPTRAQFEELGEFLTLTHIEYVIIHDTKCVKIASRINDNYIIIPCGGIMTDNKVYDKFLYKLWSIEKPRPYKGSKVAYAFTNVDNVCHTIEEERYIGCNIRPVINPI